MVQIDVNRGEKVILTGENSQLPIANCRLPIFDHPADNKSAIGNRQ